jgi:hypothetical protein
MTWAKLKGSLNIEVYDFNSLMDYWRESRSALILVPTITFVLCGRLTRTQRARLPKALLACLTVKEPQQARVLQMATR